MDFSVVTPSFRNSNWLKACVASVADQEVSVEHIVQDAGSDDGTLDWLLRESRVQAFVEPDKGMYDAINRGFSKTTGAIIAHLNCDEQYLPGALQAVGSFFASHPEIDLLFGDTVAVNPKGEYLFHRKALVPLEWHTRTCPLSTLTCATFFRRKLIDEHGLFFNDQYKIIGDGEWMSRALQAKISMGVLQKFTSVFALTGANLSLGDRAQSEWARYLETAPGFLKIARHAILLHHRLRRLTCGIYSQRPFSYSFYEPENPTQRIIHQVTRPTARWKW